MQIARVLSTWTPTQIKKHAECFFKQNLKTNSAAVKWYWESLSANKKAQVLVNDFAAHQKQQQSLSPENKVQMLCKNADAHRKQCKSFSPEDKNQVLRNDAAAHKEQWKTLSPDDKVWILTNDAAAHKKQRESLSPEQKVKVMTINAAAHKKQYELLPLEKKARRMEIRTEHRHEHLTEKETKISTQIRSVAATLYEKVDLNKPTVEFLREHFYKDPTLALAYFHCCSTDPRVAIFNDELQLDVDKSVVWNRISHLIGSPIGQEEAILCQETFNNLDQSHVRIAACASCCERLLSVDGQQGIVEMKIDDFCQSSF
jgi:hypothetical protein